MRKELLYSLISFAMLSGMTCLNTGCATGSTEAERSGSFNRQMSALQAANFRGEVFVESGGSPLGFAMSNVFAFGPQQMTFRANGQVDFTQPQVNGLQPMPREVFAAFNRRLAVLEKE